MSEFERALKADISQPMRTVVERQAAEVKRAHDEVEARRAAHR